MPFARSPILPLLACVLAAVVSLLAPIEPLYDAWAWLVWGDQLATFGLDTSAGPSWKPLPVIVAVPLAALGDIGPEIWLAITRASWLAVAVLVWRLAVRLEGTGGRPALAAGAIAAVSVFVIEDGVTAWIRQGAGGLSEPLLAALVLGAVEAALERRSGLALGLSLAACMLRPEAWPLAAAFAWREARAGRVSPWLAGAGVLAVVAAWFVPDLLAEGDPLKGADVARGGHNSPLDAIGWVLEMPPAVLWAGVALALWPGQSRLGAEGRVLTWGALAWIAIVVAMTAVGFAGLPRFMVPAVAVLCAAGAAALVRAARTTGAPASYLAGAVLAAIAVQAGVRAADVPAELERLAGDSDRTVQLRDLAGSEADPFACGEVWTTDGMTATALAWQLSLHLDEVTTTSQVAPPAGRIAVDRGADPALRTELAASGSRVAGNEEWEVFGTGRCAQTVAGAGGSGARR